MYRSGAGKRNDRSVLFAFPDVDPTTDEQCLPEGSRIPRDAAVNRRMDARSRLEEPRIGPQKNHTDSGYRREQRTAALSAISRRDDRGRIFLSLNNSEKSEGMHI